jgi:hypothetical protein
MRLMAPGYPSLIETGDAAVMVVVEPAGRVTTVNVPVKMLPDDGAAPEHCGNWAEESVVDATHWPAT